MTLSPLITTPRTYLHTPDFLTLDQIRKLDADPEIMRYITNGQPRTVKESENWLSIKLEEYKKNGFGLMPVFKKSDDSFIGWGGLKHLENSSHIEVGYRLDKTYWGQGFATEITLAIIKYAKEKLELNQLVAVTDLQNKASKRVLVKCGFKHVSEAYYYHTNVDYFELNL
ncbi:MAG: GNAT family N-acetyltransferase [Reichenbachiella sp.]|uniref:GNAT family N-acetyltransferase n=1 Tax=Reichenbachiella sp. TaxID=2184521 RepID=UPI003264EF25